MTKRLIPAIFLFVYTVSVVGSTTLRTQAWIAEHANDANYHNSQQPVRIGVWQPRSPGQVLQTKSLEDGWALPSLFAGTNPPLQETNLRQAMSALADGQTAGFISSRAPPAVVS